jgi:uncharacterized RDD family membrane protein YckC
MLGTFDDIVARKKPPLSKTIAAGVLGFVGFLLIHGYLLKKHGQTVGKYLWGIRIADLNGNVPDIAKMLLLRYLPISLAALIPLTGGLLPLVDVLFIFRGDRRCIHDLLAGTKVVKVRKS